MKQGSRILAVAPISKFLSAFFWWAPISTGRGRQVGRVSPGWRGPGLRLVPRPGQAVSAGWPRSSLAWADKADQADIPSVAPVNCHGCSELHLCFGDGRVCFTLSLMAGKWRRAGGSIITKWTLPIKLCSGQSQQFFSFQTHIYILPATSNKTSQ